MWLPYPVEIQVNVALNGAFEYVFVTQPIKTNLTTLLTCHSH